MPGRAADDYRPFSAGKLIPAGSDISFQVHYTPIGKEVVDRPLIGFTVADKRAGEALDVVRHRRRRTDLRDSAERAELQEPAVRARVRSPTSSSSR